MLHWLSPLGKSYEGGKEDFTCVELGGGGGVYFCPPHPMV